MSSGQISGHSTQASDGNFVSALSYISGFAVNIWTDYATARVLIFCVKDPFESLVTLTDPSL
jgi:hypothetical protein